MTHPVSKLIALLAFFVFFSVAGWAQNTAELQGRVVDPAGHPASGPGRAFGLRNLVPAAGDQENPDHLHERTDGGHHEAHGHDAG